MTTQNNQDPSPFRTVEQPGGQVRIECDGQTVAYLRIVDSIYRFRLLWQIEGGNEDRAFARGYEAGITAARAAIAEQFPEVTK